MLSEESTLDEQIYQQLTAYRKRPGIFKGKAVRKALHENGVGLNKVHFHRLIYHQYGKINPFIIDQLTF